VQRQAHQQERLTAQLELALRTTQASLAQIEGVVDASRQEAAELRAMLQAAEGEMQRLSALLADADVARLLEARQAGHVVSLSVAAPAADTGPTD